MRPEYYALILSNKRWSAQRNHGNILVFKDNDDAKLVVRWYDSDPMMAAWFPPTHTVWNLQRALANLLNLHMVKCMYIKISSVLHYKVKIGSFLPCITPISFLVIIYMYWLMMNINATVSCSNGLYTMVITISISLCYLGSSWRSVAHNGFSIFFICFTLSQHV